MIHAHTVAGAMLDDLALGFGGPAAIEALWAAQRSRRLLLLRLLVDRLEPTPRVDAAVAAIIAADNCDPASREVLVEPLVGAWAADAIRAIDHAVPTAEQIGHLGAVAAVASLHANTSAELHARSRDGWLYLPRLGRVRTTTDNGDVRLTTDAGRLWVDGVLTEPDTPRWQPRRSLRVGDLVVALDDVDPYRDAYHVPAANRLSTEDVAEWERLLDETWRVLTTSCSARAAELTSGLHCLVPLRKPTGNTAHSATAREAVGVVGLDLPRSPAEFAVALVHEFQHSKLSAVLDIVPLYHEAPGRTFFAPWRSDPRPIGGLLQGVYAFLAVADVWRALTADPVSHPQAEREFAEARAQVSDALDTLNHSGLLTPAGDRFLAGMRGSLHRLNAVEVSAESERDARRVLTQRRALWQSANVSG